MKENNSMKYISIISSSLSLFEDSGLVLSDGTLSAKNTGFLVSGGFTINSFGFVVTTGGLSINSGGLASHVRLSLLGGGGGAAINGGLTVSEGAILTAGGLSVQDKGLVILPLGSGGGLTVQDSGMAVIDSNSQFTNFGGVFVDGDFSVATNGLAVSGTITAKINGGLAVSGGLRVNSKGAKVTGKLNVADVGLVVDGVGLLGFGGIKVTDGGASFPAGLSIVAAGLSAVAVQVSDRGLLLQSGLSVKSAGLSCGGGLTVSTSGVVTPSVVIRNGGFSLNDGLSILSGGLAASSLTVQSVGMIVAAGRLEVADIGLAVAPIGSIRIRKDGFASEDLVAVRNNGLGVTGGVSVRSAGLKVTGGLTIDSGRVSAGGVQVASNGVKVFGGNLMAINDVGAVFEDDLKVYGGTAFQYYSLGPSDQRLKRNIVSIPKSLEIVRQIRGIEYTTLDDPSTRRFGVIAQEVERVLPSLVTPFRMSARKVAQLSVVDQNNNQEEQEGKVFKSVDYLSLVPVLLNSIADLLLSREKSVVHNKKNCSFASLSDSSLLFTKNNNGTVAIDNDDRKEVEEEDEKNSNQWSGEFSCGCYRKYQNKIEELFSELETLQNERKSLQSEELMERMKAGQFV
jgi:hypothetical protein